MSDLELLEQIVDEIEKVELEEKSDAEELFQKRELLLDCAVDELNDEIMKLELNDIEITGKFWLLREGNYSVYRNEGSVVNVLTSKNFLGGEEFRLDKVERGFPDQHLINFVFVPLNPSNFRRLILPCDDAVAYMSGEFERNVFFKLMPSLESIDKELRELQLHFQNRKRKRVISASKSKIYQSEGSW